MLYIKFNFLKDTKDLQVQKHVYVKQKTPKTP